jgi:hypothetical protein
MTDKDKLLAVLDMSEDEQKNWCFRNTHTENGIIKVQWYFLSDLAFRLRDEVDDTRMHNAMYKIQQYMSKKDSSIAQPEDYATAFWGLYHAKPIHWVIASLIAKEMSNGNTSENV